MTHISGTFGGYPVNLVIGEDTPAVPMPPAVTVEKPEPWGRGTPEVEYPTARPITDNVPPDDNPDTGHTPNPNQGTPPADGSAA